MFLRGVDSQAATMEQSCRLEHIGFVLACFCAQQHRAFCGGPTARRLSGQPGGVVAYAIHFRRLMPCRRREQDRRPEGVRMRIGMP